LWLDAVAWIFEKKNLLFYLFYFRFDMRLSNIISKTGVTCIKGYSSNILHTPLCDGLDISIPFVQPPIAPYTSPQFVAGVSSAGGLTNKFKHSSKQGKPLNLRWTPLSRKELKRGFSGNLKCTFPCPAGGRRGGKTCTCNCRWNNC
jgi:hypothetical protein